MNTDKIYAEQLANEYALKDTSKVIALRKLDKKAKLPATVFTYTFGIIAALVAGVGMCLSMKVIGSGTTAMFVLGVIVGISDCWAWGSTIPSTKSCWHRASRNTPLRSWNWRKRSARNNAWSRQRCFFKSCCIRLSGC